MPLGPDIRIDQLLAGDAPTVSFEFFPPKSDDGWAALYRAIGELHAFHPSFVSVTYGAGGGTRRKTVGLVSRIQSELGIRAMAHLTCIGHTQAELGEILDQLWSDGIRNVLSLRGDPPSGQTQFVATPGGFAFANELTGFVRSRGDFCIGVAGYPEGHPQCLNRTRDMENLRKKVDAGGNFVITQLFFDNSEFYRFRDEAGKMGIDVPIIAGIMPIMNVSQIKRFISMCGAKIPHPLLLRIEAVEQDADAVQAIGVEYAAQQCQDLLKNGIRGLHFYTLNKSKATLQIVKDLGIRPAV